MDEAIHVDQLHCSCGRIKVRKRRSQRFPSQVNECRTQSLAATQCAVTHRLAQARGPGIWQSKAAVEHLLDARPISVHPGWKRYHRGLSGTGGSVVIFGHAKGLDARLSGPLQENLDFLLSRLE